MCGCVNELYLSKVLELDQQTASAVMAATAATLSLRATLTVNVMSTKSACFCNWKAEVVILRVWKYYRKDSFRERHFCWITRFVAKNTSLVQWEACGNLASCDLFQEDDGERVEFTSRNCRQECISNVLADNLTWTSPWTRLVYSDNKIYLII